MVFHKDRYLNWFKLNNNSDIEFLDFSLESLLDAKDIGPGHHPIESGHQLIANRIIAEIDSKT
jgi:hypothetical protein